MLSSKQRGFTLIELVVVIVILGILAAFAVPRFMGLETQARIASVSALEGTLRSSATMAHGVWLASGSPATIAFEGQTITMTFGYPNRLTMGNTLATGTVVATGQAGRFAYNTGTGVFTLNGAVTPANCSVTYTAATSVTAPATISVPVTTGC